MFTLGPRPRTHQLLLSLGLVVAACASHPSSQARRPSPVDLNAPASRAPTADADPRRAARADIPIGESRRYARMEELLAHRAPGLDVRSRGGGRFVLALRGRPAIGGDEVLVVIDGMRYHRGGADMLAQLSPAQVLRVEVLRDVAATSAYGNRGANGVVVVTTRRPE